MKSWPAAAHAVLLAAWAGSLWTVAWVAPVLFGSLDRVTAGNIAATGGLAKLIGEKEFSILFHEGEKDNLHISIVGGRVILVVLFDNRSSLGLVRLRVKKSSEELSAIFEKLMKKSEEREKRGSADFPFAEITDDDIDNLFS